jgi:hypothetical protein
MAHDLKKWIMALMITSQNAGNLQRANNTEMV